MNRSLSLVLCLLLAALCSCKHDEPLKKKEKPELTSPPPESFRVPRGPHSLPLPPPVALSPEGATSPQDDSTEPTGAGGTNAISPTQGADGNAAAQGNATLTPAAASSAAGGSAGTGHTDPLGDPTQRLVAPEERLEIPGAEQAATAGGEGEDLPMPEPQPVSKPEIPAQPAPELPPTQLSSEEIERLPPDRRAAVLRYLKAMQNQRAATQKSGGAQ